ncbi:MAG: hypothetical protein V4555_21135 [Acidobacteriota bacterium]
MSNSKLTSDFVRRTLALTAILGASVAVMGAQTATGTTTDAQAGVNVTASTVAASPLFSSSTADDASPAETTQMAAMSKPFNFFNAMQYGGRQSYGRPRYRGGNTNPDGSSKWDFFGGGGFTTPVGTQSDYMTTGWGLQAGGGRMFNAHFGVNLEFDYDHLGLSQSTLTNQLNLYNNQITLFNQYCASNPTNSTCVAAQAPVSLFGELGGNTHVYSLTLQPVYNLRSGEGLGAYVTGGFGYYHKVTDFTTPEIGEYCDYYYGCYQYQANQIIDHYTSNAPGVNGGIGFTYKFSKFSNERLYGEVRYVYVLNSARTGVNASTCTTLSCASSTIAIANDFPQNSNRTSYFPVKFGIRF